MHKQASPRLEKCALVTLMVWCVVVCPLVADDILLTWNPNEENDIEGYKVYYGMAPGNYSTSLLLGNQTSYRVEALVTGVYYFAVTAINDEGLESDFSNEVSYAVGEPFTTTLVFPRFVSGAAGAASPSSSDPPASAHLEENTGMAVANLDAKDATIRFTAFDKGGGYAPGGWNHEPGVALARKRHANPNFGPGGLRDRGAESQSDRLDQAREYG